MKVYLLTYQWYDETYIIGVYSTEDKAEASLLVDSTKMNRPKDEYDIKELELE